MSEHPPSNRPSDPPGPTGIVKLRWIIGIVCVLVFYFGIFLGVYLNLAANQAALLTLGITGIPAIAMWLTFLMNPDKKNPTP